ncbi:hypothetical protein [Streptomyces sp. SP18CS02]|uniref:hypothetical protein n=1 Tax=Streptomyces sp. SP18CS02 TaxID=3002531 RepID=UPI002E78BE77|nr:hypothetical protein [Streptomyces sp. SP18CS02]MEE1754494.1 hypothetical protein [Streptomyces sp. SP18CS02]
MPPGSFLKWEQIADGDDVDEGKDVDAVPRAVHTPNDARLADLAGPVIRVEILREFHVRDQQAVLKAARSAGWEPQPNDDREGDDPQDVVGAVMRLGESDSEIEGADTVTDTSEGLRLRTENGHEVADWSEEAVVADFGAGWRYAAAVRRGEPATPSTRKKSPGLGRLTPGGGHPDPVGPPSLLAPQAARVRVITDTVRRLLARLV